MSRIAERHRILKTLDGLPPRTDPEGRVQYVWNRIREEAAMITTCHQQQQSSQNTTISTPSSNTTNNLREMSSTPTNNNNSNNNGTGTNNNNNNNKTSGRMASISVQRLLQFNVLSASSLLHSVTRRISRLCAGPVSTAMMMSTSCSSSHHTDAKTNNNDNNNNNVDNNIELDQDELVEYFRFYNDWHFEEDDHHVNHSCSVSHHGSFENLAENDNHHHLITTSSEQSATDSPAKSLDHASSTTPLAQPPQCLLAHPEKRNDVVFQSFNDQRRRFKKSLDFTLEQCIAEDLIANYDRDPAQMRIMEPLLYNKGFHALQLHRLAERLWYSGEIDYSLLLQSVSARFFGLDIHPGSRIGVGVMIDHGTGVVIGETAVVGNNVSMLHNVTLGGTGKETVDRHPKVGNGVLLGAGASILGNVTIGENARVAAGAVVVKHVGDNSTMVGVAARELQQKKPLQLLQPPPPSSQQPQSGEAVNSRTVTETFTVKGDNNKVNDNNNNNNNTNATTTSSITPNNTENKKSQHQQQLLRDEVDDLDSLGFFTVNKNTTSSANNRIAVTSISSSTTATTQKRQHIIEVPTETRNDSRLFKQQQQQEHQRRDSGNPLNEVVPIQPDIIVATTDHKKGTSNANGAVDAATNTSRQASAVGGTTTTTTTKKINYAAELYMSPPGVTMDFDQFVYEI